MIIQRKASTCSGNDLLFTIHLKYAKSYWWEFDFFIWEITLDCDDKLLDRLIDLANIAVKRDMSCSTENTCQTKATSLTKLLREHYNQKRMKAILKMKDAFIDMMIEFLQKWTLSE